MEKITDYRQLVEYLKANSNKDYDEFNRKIINSSIATIGCKTPFIRKLAKSYTVEDLSAFPDNIYVEIDLLKGIVISNSKLPYEEKATLLTDFAHTIENWAVCDCSTVNAAKAEREQYFEYFRKLAASNKTFVSRYGIVNLLSNYLDQEHIGGVFSALKSVSLWGEYYVDMAAAWLVATAMAKCRNETMEYMNGEGRLVLNKFAYNKALQKMRESYRVSQEDKQWTYTKKII